MYPKDGSRRRPEQDHRSPGRLIGTHNFTIAIHIKKQVTWSKSVEQTHQAKTSTYSKLSPLIGKLNHVCYTTPDTRHFMNNPRQMKSITRRRGKVVLSQRTLDDLILWLDFLKSAKAGISINRVTFRKLAITTFTFGDQKSDIKDKTVSQDRTNNPVQNSDARYAKTIQHIMNYPRRRGDPP